MLYCVLWILIASNFANLTHAQDWPRRPVRMVVPFAAGGGNDISARIIAQPLTEELGQQFIIDKLHAAVARVTQQQNVRDAFVKATRPVYDKWKTQIGANLVNAAEKSIAARKK